MEQSTEMLKRIWSEWDIVEKIGEGSFGCVYKIVRNDTGKDFYAALKIIDIPRDFSEYNGVKADGLDEESAGTFFRELTDECLDEIKIMYSLKGTDNIVSIEDYKVTEQVDENGRKQYHIFIRMELLQNLAEYIERNISGKDKDTVCREAVKIGVDLCSALELCAKENIIHRDIKMQNVFVSPFGKFKLGDFNISKHLEDRTSAMSRKGTMGYLAPEVYNGDGYNSSVDIYSLGMLLYRILHNNRAPFIDPNMPVRPAAMETAVTRRLSGEKIEPPFNATPELAAVILKALEYEPSKRYASASEFKAALLGAGKNTAVNTVVPNNTVPNNRAANNAVANNTVANNVAAGNVAAGNVAQAVAAPVAEKKPEYAVMMNAPAATNNNGTAAVKKSGSSAKGVILAVCISLVVIGALVAIVIGIRSKTDGFIEALSEKPSFSELIDDTLELAIEEMEEPSEKTTEENEEVEITRAEVADIAAGDVDEETAATMSTEENNDGNKIENKDEDKNTTEETSGRVTVTKEEDKEFRISYTSGADKGVKLVPECRSSYFGYYDGNDGESFRMGGIEYTEGFTINKYVEAVTYKLDGKYTNMHFICGKLDSTQGQNTKVVAALDGKEKDLVYHADYIHLPEEVNIDVTGVNELTLYLAYGCSYGFADIYFYDDGTVPPASVYTSNAPADRADFPGDIRIIDGYEYKLYEGEPDKDGKIPAFTMVEEKYENGAALYSGNDNSFYGSHIAFNMRGSNYTNLHFACGKIDNAYDIPTDLWIEIDGEKQLVKSYKQYGYGGPIEFDIDISGAEIISIDLFDTYAGTTAVLGFTDFYFYNKNLYQKPEIQKKEAVPEINPAYIWDDIEPYEVDKECVKYHHNLDRKLPVAGTDYDLGIKLDNCGFAAFDCDGKYTNLRFKCGRVTDTRNSKCQLFAVIDGEEIVVDTYKKGETDIREYDIDITDADVVRLYVTGDMYDVKLGIVDLYFCNTNYPMDTQ